MKFEGKVVLVSSGATGMGKAATEMFAREGAKVAFGYQAGVEKMEAAAKKVLNKITDAGGKVMTLPVDITKEGSVVSMVCEVAKKYGTIDILLNSAGMFDGNKLTHEMEERTFDLVQAVNLKGIFLMCKHVLPYMMKQNKGNIVNIASIAGLRASNGGIAYTSSKFGVIGLTQKMAIEYGSYHIRVNALCPGFTITPFDNDSNNMSEFALKHNKIPAGRAGTVTDMANAIKFLASDDSDYMTGTHLLVDGGKYIKWDNLND